MVYDGRIVIWTSSFSKESPVVSGSFIELRGVRVHNLKGIDLDLPLGKFIVICGRSGSGKTSLAMDTLYAEGQRRYLESFSAYSRQFLARLEKPQAESIQGIPAAIAVSQAVATRAENADVGSATEIVDHLRVLIAGLGEIICPHCQTPVAAMQPQQVVSKLAEFPPGRKLLITFPTPTQFDATEHLPRWRAAGLVRLMVGERMVSLDQYEADQQATRPTHVIVDRLSSEKIEPNRANDSISTSYQLGHGQCEVLLEVPAEQNAIVCEDLHWRRHAFSQNLKCFGCGQVFLPLQPSLLNFNSPLGACFHCQGQGEVPGGANGPSKSSGRKRDRATLVACPACHGTRLNAAALAVHFADKNIVAWRSLTVANLRREIGSAFAPQAKFANVLSQITARLDFLTQVGLSYLTLDRPVASLSRGEAQRVALTSALASSLVHMLYILDEPTLGLHPTDTPSVLAAIQRLRDRGNTVIVVEHDELMLNAAERIIEIGPEAGQRGGEIVFQGTPAELVHCESSRTGDYLAGRLGQVGEKPHREPNHGWLKLVGARGNNLANLTVEFPLGVLCAITGVSGAGKSSLVEETLYPALRARLNLTNETVPLPFDELYGPGQLENVVFVDSSPTGRSPRSNPITYIKAFDEIRQVFAQTVDAKVNNFTVGHFSFNGVSGRCPHCSGDGAIKVDMQFLPDIFMRCPVCQGARYRKEILRVKYRGRSIAEVLELTVREAFLFFRGQKKVQAKLKRLMDVGLDYLQLGQGAHTLSGGEAQRMKLAVHLQTSRRGRSLFILEEPTVGLHFQDITQLLDCFDSLLAVGHSLIVIEHNLQVIRAADYVIDMGPGAAAEGGKIVAQGTPAEIAAVSQSRTGAALRQ